MNNKRRVAVIGAGVSGLAAAVTLAKRPDLDLTIFEARREPGGRTRSFIDTTTGDTLDNGQHLLASCYTSTLSYLKLIGTDHLVQRQKTLAIHYRDQTQVRRLRLPNITSPADLAVGLLSSSLLSSRDKLAAIRVGNAVRKNRLPVGLNELSVSELLVAMGQSHDAIARLWEPIVLATINADITIASAAVFVNVLRELFFSADRASSLLFPEVGLSDLLVTPAVKLLKNASWKLGESVRSLEQHDQQVSVVTDSGVVSYDAVLTSNLSLAGIAEPAFSPIVNAYFWLDRLILHAPITGFLGSTLQWAFPKPSAYSKQLLALTVSAADELVSESSDQIVARLWDELRSCVPKAAKAALLRSQVIKEKRATPRLDASTQAKRPQTWVHGSRVFLIGDYVQNGLPATIEGAIRNGLSGARGVLHYLDTY